MTLALRLAQNGQRVTLFEAASQLGGLASAWKLGDVTWDRHYHVTLLSDTHLRALLAELQLEQEINWVETKTGFFTNGQLYSMSNTIEFLRFPPLNLLEKFRLGFTIFLASRLRDGQRLERVNAADWLMRWSGKGVFQKIWLPLLRAKLGDNYRKTSAAFIWSTIARMYAARRTGLKKEMFGYVPGGYARILEQFGTELRSVGVEIRLASPIRNIATEDGRVIVNSDDDDHELFDKAVTTVPSPLVGKLCPQLGDDERKRFTNIEYQGIICASLLLTKPLAQHYVTNITDEWVPYTAVIEMSTLVDRSEFGGHCLVYLPKYVGADDTAFDRDDDYYRGEFLSALERMYSHFSCRDVLDFRISRVRNVMALPTLNYSQRMPPIQTSEPSVFAVNSAHIVNATLNVNETVRLAEWAVEQILLPTVCDRTTEYAEARC